MLVADKNKLNGGKMNDFKKYQTDSTDALMNFVGIADGELVFTENKLDSAGHAHAGCDCVKFTPLNSVADLSPQKTVLSLYLTKGIASTKLAQILRIQTNLKPQNKYYYEFINRTAIFIAGQIIRKNEIDVIVLPRTASKLLFDIVENISVRNSNIVYWSESFDDVPADTRYKSQFDKNILVVTDIFQPGITLPAVASVAGAYLANKVFSLSLFTRNL